MTCGSYWWERFLPPSAVASYPHEFSGASGDLGLILVSHDLSVVRQVADRVAVMYLGRIMELGATDVVWASPRHPYTEALVAAIPHADGAGPLR